MTEKRYSHDGVIIIDHLKKDLIYIEGKENLLELAEYVDRLQDENEELKKENYELHKRLGDFEPFEEHIKERTSKTFVNDIIGLVKTDEPTDIVELEKGVERMTECNAIIEANNEIDELKRENKELNELCVKYGFEVGRLEEENKQLKQHNAELIHKIDFLEQIIDGDVE